MHQHELQVLRQAGDGTYLAILESAIVAKLRELDLRLQQLLQSRQQQVPQVAAPHTQLKQAQTSAVVAAGQQPRAAEQDVARLADQQYSNGRATLQAVPASTAQNSSINSKKAYASGDGRAALQDRSNVWQVQEQVSASGSNKGEVSKTLPPKPSQQLAAMAMKSSRHTINQPQPLNTKQQLLMMTTKEQALGKRTRCKESSENMPLLATSAGQGSSAAPGNNLGVMRKATKQSAGATLSSVWSKLLGGHRDR